MTLLLTVAAGVFLGLMALRAFDRLKERWQLAGRQTRYRRELDLALKENREFEAILAMVRGERERTAMAPLTDQEVEEMRVKWQSAQPQSPQGPSVPDSPGGGAPPDHRAVEDADPTEAAITAHLDKHWKFMEGRLLPVLQQRLPVAMQTNPFGPDYGAQEEWQLYRPELDGFERFLLTTVPEELPDIFDGADRRATRPELDAYLTKELGTRSQLAACRAALVVVQALDAARAARELPKLDPSSDNNFGEDLANLWGLYAMARLFRQQMGELVADIVDKRAQHVEHTHLALFQNLLSDANRLDICRDLLTKGIKSPEPRPKTGATDQWESFRDAVDSASMKLRDEMHNRIPEWWEVADLGGLRPMMDKIIDVRIAQLADALITQGEALYRATVPQAGYGDGTKGSVS